MNHMETRQPSSQLSPDGNSLGNKEHDDSTNISDECQSQATESTVTRQRLDTCTSIDHSKHDSPSSSNIDANDNDVLAFNYSISGADAAAGFGPSFLHHPSTNVLQTTTIDNDIDPSGRRIEESNILDESDYSFSSSPSSWVEDEMIHHDCDSPDFAPGLVPLSILEDENDYDDEEDEINPSNQLGVSSSSFEQYYSQTNSVHYEEEKQQQEKETQIDHLKKIQDKLRKIIMFHPKSIRSYCQSRSSLRKAIKMKNCQHSFINEDQEYEERDSSFSFEDEPYSYFYNHIISEQNLFSSSTQSLSRQRNFHILYIIIESPLFSNEPFSILLDLASHSLLTTGQVIQATFIISSSSIHTVLSILFRSISQIWSQTTSILNPHALLDMILRLTGNNMGEVIATGIQSVASNVGSAGGAAIYVISHTAGSSGILVGGGKHVDSGVGVNSVGSSARSATTNAATAAANLLNGGRKNDGRINEKMFRKLSKIDSPARVISYVERQDEVLTQHAKKRVQRMMHYPVSLRPFNATIKLPPKTCKNNGKNDNTDNITRSTVSFDNIDNFPLPLIGNGASQRDFQTENDTGSVCSDSDDDSDSPFMCTPKSFPPTPTSRSHVLARGTRFTEDVVYLARDQLRLEDGLESENEQTRVMAKALKDGRTYAVFNAADVGNGINLTCGYHCASKVGNDIYCSVRGMIPVLRNRFVYFEMSVSTPALLSMMLHHASLSIGLSTLEMPLNALVGAWKGSVGLCSTGQILAGSQWCSPLGSPKTYGSQSHVGVLVYLDDASAFETWDGVMVIASTVFNVNGEVVEVNGLGENLLYHSSSSQSIKSMSDLVSQGDEMMRNAGMQQDDDRFQIDLNQPHPLPLFVPRDEELFPTLTLHSSQTEVLCRFCSEDIIAKTRYEIGAPPGVTVYAIDGSVMIDEDE